MPPPQPLASASGYGTPPPGAAAMPLDAPIQSQALPPSR
jgi:hypothetical protein